MNIAIGIDFGTNFTYIGFVHGKETDGTDKVQELVSAKDASRGIPSVYWNDGKTELTGRDALRKYRSRPEYGVVSIKSKLSENKLKLGNTEYTPLEIIRRMLTSFLETAENILKTQYALNPTSLDIILTVPVAFDQAQIRLLRRAAESVVLPSGTAVLLKSIVQEPVASAVRFLGIHSAPNDYIAVFDLGGGTLDVAVVHYEPSASSPYRVVDQDGDDTLGGDRWDEKIIQVLETDFRKKYQTDPSDSIRRKFTTDARELKEELTENELADVQIQNEGDYIELSVSRKEFEAASEDLTNRAVTLLKTVLARQKNKKISHLILTGGGSRMPQIQNAIRKAGFLPPNVDIRCFNPEKSIAEGAALLSNFMKFPQMQTSSKTSDSQKKQSSGIANIAPHGYGIVTNVPQRNNEPLIRIFFLKNTPLAASGTGNSVMGNLPEEKRRISLYSILETDVLEKGTDPYEKGKYILIDGVPYTALYQGREVLDAILTRSQAVPAGTPVTETLSMNESLQLDFSAEDTANHAGIRHTVDIQGKKAKF